jgi:hypothetical protein
MTQKKAPELKNYSLEIQHKLQSIKEDVEKVNALLTRFDLPRVLITTPEEIPAELKLSFGSRIPAPEVGDVVMLNPRFGEGGQGTLLSVANGVAKVMTAEAVELTFIASQLIRVSDLESVKRRNEAAAKAAAARRKS